MNHHDSTKKTIEIARTKFCLIQITNFLFENTQLLKIEHICIKTFQIMFMKKRAIDTHRVTFDYFEKRNVQTYEKHIWWWKKMKKWIEMNKIETSSINQSRIKNIKKLHLLIWLHLTIWCATTFATSILIQFYFFYFRSYVFFFDIIDMHKRLNIIANYNLLMKKNEDSIIKKYLHDHFILTRNLWTMATLFYVTKSYYVTLLFNYFMM